MYTLHLTLNVLIPMLDSPIETVNWRTISEGQTRKIINSARTSETPDP